ncbi:hypothetical protein KSP39_PZI020213 [Platanthera zijinensis]|uniref:Uncharacterized protein n=1 Tax=Platanthera zijinensis TaxID=2320716 RepID=A0AAP0AZ97_9ASPA
MQPNMLPENLKKPTTSSSASPPLKKPKPEPFHIPLPFGAAHTKPTMAGHLLLSPSLFLLHILLHALTFPIQWPATPCPPLSLPLPPFIILLTFIPYSLFLLLP